MFVASHLGLVGIALLPKPQDEGSPTTASRQELDLRDQSEVWHWSKANRPEHVFLVAGTVGGIMADSMTLHGTVVHVCLGLNKELAQR